MSPRYTLRRTLRSGLRGATAIAALMATAASAAAPGSAPSSTASPDLAGRPFPATAMTASAMTSAAPRAIDRAAYAPPASLAGTAEADPGRTVRVGTGSGATRTLAIPRGKSATVELPVDAGDVLVSDPKIADVVLSTPRRIQIMGLASGQTDAQFVDGMGRRILHLDIRVDQDAGAAAQTLETLLPGTRVKVSSANGNLILSGEAANAAEADRAMRLASSFVAEPNKVVNLINIAGGEQVMLKVKIVEVNRSVLKQLGFDVGALIGAAGGPQYSFVKNATFGVAGSLLGGLTGGYNVDTTTQPASALSGTTSTIASTGTGYTSGVLVDPVTGLQIVRNGSAVTYRIPNDVASTNATTTITGNGLPGKAQSVLTGRVGESGVNKANGMIEAFERVGLIRTLAEPNLTAVSGEAGHFLVGGEFPVPTSQDTQGRVSIEFKPYGVGLGYVPIVLGPGRISLKLSTEVSELTSVGGFTLTTSSSTPGGTSGPALVVPGLNVRRAETTVELPSGGAMMIAGLLQSQTKQTLDSLPGLMQLPVLGSLFRSRDFQNNETELVIIVTPYIVKPVRPEDLSTPADGLKIASDLETNLLGRLNSGFGKSATATAGKTYQGPFGYVVD